MILFKITKRKNKIMNESNVQPFDWVNSLGMAHTKRTSGFDFYHVQINDTG